MVAILRDAQSDKLALLKKQKEEAEIALNLVLAGGDEVAIKMAGKALKKSRKSFEYWQQQLASTDTKLAAWKGEELNTELWSAGTELLAKFIDL